MSEQVRDLMFSFSYAELMRLTYEKEALLTRDVTELTPRGITTARLTAFNGLRTAFVAIPSDSTVVATISQATRDRDLAAYALRTAIRDIQGIAANTFGEGSPEHKAFAPKGMSEATPGELLLLAPTIVAQGNLFLTAMTPKGLTAAMLTDVTNKGNTLKTKITAFELAEGSQPITTANRHKAANALYSEMSNMCQAANNYYKERDPIKAEQYVIYDLGTNVQQRTGSVAVKATVSREIDELKNKSLFKFKVIGNSDLQFYFSKTEAGDPGPKSLTVQPNLTIYKEATAADLGYDKENGVTQFCIRNVGTAESGYRIFIEG